MRSRFLVPLAAVAAAVLFAAVGCQQTRPVPVYQPLIALDANSARQTSLSASSFRPSWSGPKPAPRAGGG